MEGPPAPSPEVRARHPQMLLRMAEAVAAPIAVGGATRAALDAADPMDWLPVEIDVEVVEAIAARLDAEASTKVLQDRQREEMRSSVFSSFVETALRAFAPSPVNMVERLPAGWGRIFRNAGWVAVVSMARNVAVARFHGLPRVCVESAPWMSSLPVSMAVLYELISATGTVECRIEDAAQGLVLCTFRWK